MPGRWNRPELTVPEILAWADAHHRRTGAWPQCNGGRIVDTLDDTWHRVDRALRIGLRGLPGRSSLTQLLAEERGVRNPAQLPALTVPDILAWADGYHERTGAWPLRDSGAILEAPGETWGRVDKALLEGLRGLPGGSSLPRLLAERRGVRNLADVAPYAEEQILAWADKHFEYTGRWPTRASGPIPDAPGETWHAVESALVLGRRGLRKGSSLAQLLEWRRGVPHRLRRPLTRKQIVAWMDAHHERTGEWPQRESGPIPEAPKETWKRIDSALLRGCRGLRGGLSLARLLHSARGVRNDHDLPPLSEDQIVRWARVYHSRRGRWPSQYSGSIPGTRGETWCGVHTALLRGHRGLPKGSSLARLLAERGLKRHPMALPDLSHAKILRWADRHLAETGEWPRQDSGRVLFVRGETWQNVNAALRDGRRGLAGGSSVAKLLAEYRDVRNQGELPAVTEEQVLAWADSHKARTGEWPKARSGSVEESPGDTWGRIDKSLRKGHRGLPGGSSLARLLLEHRGVQHKHARAEPASGLGVGKGVPGA